MELLYYVYGIPTIEKKHKHFCGRTRIYGGITLINCVKTVDP